MKQCAQKNDCDNTMLGKASKRVRADDRDRAHWETLVLFQKYDDEKMKNDRWET